ncbi:unnamed protein product [Orchesella dallaii]|uniref:Prosaposin n=1 Tax=Orchesella dallaii TaxID=48710 RepID=A0ABP1Q930_9HEXA
MAELCKPPSASSSFSGFKVEQFEASKKNQLSNIEKDPYAEKIVHSKPTGPIPQLLIPNQNQKFVEMCPAPTAAWKSDDMHSPASQLRDDACLKELEKMMPGKDGVVSQTVGAQLGEFARRYGAQGDKLRPRIRNIPHPDTPDYNQMNNKATLYSPKEFVPHCSRGPIHQPPMSTENFNTYAGLNNAWNYYDTQSRNWKLRDNHLGSNPKLTCEETPASETSAADVVEKCGAASSFLPDNYLKGWKMTDNKMYLILVVALTFGAWVNAYPHKGAYVVRMTGDDEAASYQNHRQEQGLLGRNMCTRGPAYWCHNITQAAECNAVKHCIKKVWENPKEKLPEDNDSVCEVCLDMVKQARDQLLSNETQDELRQVLEGSCNLIPLKLVAKECCDLADDFIPELIDALTSRMDPQMVCHVSGLCNSVRIDEMLGEMKEIDGPKKVKPLDPANVDTCPMCEHYIGSTVDYLKGLTKDGLRDRLLTVCGFLGSYSDGCRHNVIEDLDKIYEYLQNNAKPKELCTLLGLCPTSTLHRVQLLGSRQQVSSTSVRVWQPPQENDEDLECDFCKQLAETLRQFLVANQTKDEFKQVIEGLCKQTGKFKNECLNLAYQYAESIYVLLNNDFNPEQICQRIGVCKSSLQHIQLARDNAPIWTILPIKDNSRKFETSSSSEEDDDSLVMMDLLPAERLAGDDEIKPVDSHTECQFCEYALHYIQQYLDDADTEEEIKKKVDKLCDTYLPKGFAQQCDTFVEQYGDALVNLLAQEVDPSEVCPRLKLCAAPKPNPETAVGHPVKDILPTCALCTFTVEKLIDLVGKNMTKAQIDAAAEEVCKVMPRSIQEDCLSFMRNYGDQVAEMILIYGTSHGVCAAIHLCLMSPPPQKIVIESQLPMDRYLPQSVTLDRVNEIDAVNNDSPGCVICEFVITTLDQQLQDNATEEEIKDKVENACTYLPKTVEGRCKVLIETFGEEIIQYLSQEVDPAEICSRLGLCKDTKKKNDAIRHLNMDRCELCMLVSDYLSTFLEESDVDKTIEYYVEKTCALIPQSYRQECNALIEDYGTYILNLLAQETDKGKVCAQVQLCPAVSTGADIDENTVEEFEY